MKTTVDLPDPLFRRAKATAAERGVSLKTFITRAVELDLAQSPRPWSSFLRDLPVVPKATLQTVRQRIAKADADDLAAQPSRKTP